MTITLLRFALGYAISSVYVGAFLLVSGDRLAGVFILLGLWMPVTVFYAIVCILSLKLLRISKVLGGAELCGLCTGAFPLLCDLWPTHMWRWDLATRYFLFQSMICRRALSVGGAFIR